MTRHHHPAARRLATALVLAAASASACAGMDPQPAQMLPGSADMATPAAPDATVPYEPAPPTAYVAKVKNLLTGLPPSDAEVAAAQKDPQALRGLIDQWMQLPQFQEKAFAFFRQAFQQEQITAADLYDQVPPGLPAHKTALPMLMQNIQESFARTVWQLVQENRPLTEAITTERFMLTPPLMALLAFEDIRRVDDANVGTNKVTNKMQQMDPKLTIVFHRDGDDIPASESIDPKSPNYMHWKHEIPLAGDKNGAGCDQPVATMKGDAAVDNLFGYFFGYFRRLQGCQNSKQGAPLWTEADFADWRMVTIQKATKPQEITKFYDQATLRAAKQIKLAIPRVGFFSTPAFFANWQTNTSNQARVTMNQTLIVALGKSFDDSNSISPVKETALNAEHADPTSACYACHKTLDPMRQFFRQAYTLGYSDQTDPKQTSQKGVFAFYGVTAEGNDLRDLASMLAQHPRFATAWTQKVCYFANSAGCTDNDPEFLRIVNVFQQSGFNFKTLLREMLSSPLTTGAANTATFDDRGYVITINRRAALCTALANRLGVPDLCGLSGSPSLTAGQKKAAGLANDLPADGYSRGSEAPVQANDPNLFFRSGTENLCRVFADQLVDTKTPHYSSKNVDAALDDFVHNLMALAGADARSVPIRHVLRQHFDGAVASGANPTDALKSTFVLACESPTSLATGL